MSNRWTVLLLISLLLSSSGCLFPESGSPMVQFEGNFNSSGSNFGMEGTVRDTSITSDPPTYRNVTIYLYAEDGTLIQRVPVGTLDEGAEVSISSDEVPEYVILDSPDFYGGEVEVGYYTRRESTWAEEIVDRREELPVQPG